MNDEQLTAVFAKAAEKAVAHWMPEQWDRQKQEVDDLSQDLWLWYMKRPGTRAKMEQLSEPEAVETARVHAMQILSERALEANTFRGQDLYSGDSVREVLRGESTNKYLNRIMPVALKNLANRHQRYAEAIHLRYEEGTVPDQNTPEHFVLVRAVKSLTQEVNLLYITVPPEFIGSKTAVFPETRKQRGGYSDPTGNTVVLLDENPEYRHHFYEETSMDAYLGGAGSQPEFVLGKKNGKIARYRRAS